MGEGKLRELGCIETYRGVKVEATFGHRGTGEIDAFYWLRINDMVLPGGVGGMGLASEEQARAACVDEAKKRIDYMLSQRPLDQW